MYVSKVELEGWRENRLSKMEEGWEVIPEITGLYYEDSVRVPC